MELNIKRLKEDALIPQYGSKYAAGLDIFSYNDYEVLPNTRILVSTGVSMAMSGPLAKEYYLRVAPRSGLSVKSSIDIGAGVVDYDYRGEVFVCFINNGLNSYKITKGDRIAQLIPTKIATFDNINVVEDLQDTERGNNGFGSSGK